MSSADPHSETIASGAGDALPVLADRYEIRGLLGSGAMGTVYRALDRELDEVIALKILKKELASAEMVERFRREVKLARRVTHRNVARTYDIGEHGGDRFLTMEFIEGEMLAGLLARKGKLALRDVVRIGLDVCSGLSAAHAANVLHRDLKPENVILARDGRAVITDFGIARVVAAGELSQTHGGIVGTPAYMAPEQVEGSTDLDARADLYALGTMLFELLTGVMAWQGDSVVTIAAGRLLRPPPDVRAIDPNVPPLVAELVLKLMARQRSDRFPSAEATASALEAVATPSIALPVPPSLGALRSADTSFASVGSSSVPTRVRPTPAVPRGARSVAVLPVLNHGASDDAYLVEGMNEDLVDLLSVVRGLLVRPRGDTARFDDKTRDVRTIGHALGVDVVVDASLRRAGELVRASFRLITVEDGFQLWARRFDRAPSEVLSIADDAAHAIAEALTAEMSARPAREIDPETEDLYLRGRFLLRRGWNSSMKEAAEILGRAQGRAPDDARVLGAYSLAVARCYGMEFTGREVAEQARTLANRALDTDPRQAEAKCALATLHLASGEPEAAARNFRAVIDVSPNCVDAYDWLGRIMTEVGLVDEGLAMLERAIAIDPECAGARNQLARIRGLFGGRAVLLEWLGDIPKSPHDIPPWLLLQARDAMWRRDIEATKATVKLLAEVDIPQSSRFPIQSLIDVALGSAAHLLRPEHVARVLPVDASRPPRRAAFNAQLRSELFLSVGDYDQALESLKAADSNGFFDIVFLDHCPLLAPIRSHPEFIGVRARVGERAKRVIASIRSGTAS